MICVGPVKPVFQPTVRAMWAGTMLVNRLRQSAKAGLKVTVTVRPFGHRPTLRSAVVPGSQAAPPEGSEPDDRLDLAVAGGRGGVVGLPADVGVGGFPLWACQL